MHLPFSSSSLSRASPCTDLDDSPVASKLFTFIKYSPAGYVNMHFLSFAILNIFEIFISRGAKTEK